MAFKVADYPLAASIESTLRQGAAMGIIASADLATGLSTVLANIDTRVNTTAPIHVSLRPMVEKVKWAVKVAFPLFAEQGSSVMTGGSLSAVYALCPGTPNAPGFEV